MTLEWPAVAAAATLCGFGLSFATFWFTFGSRLSRAESDAKAAKEDTDKANERLTIMAAAFGSYREQVAKEYLSRDIGREMEDRITGSVERLGTRLDRLVEALASK